MYPAKLRDLASGTDFHIIGQFDGKKYWVGLNPYSDIATADISFLKGQIKKLFRSTPEQLGVSFYLHDKSDDTIVHGNGRKLLSDIAKAHKVILPSAYF